MKTDLVKGFNDYLGEDARKRQKITNIIRNNFELYGFEPAETPIVETLEFVKGENPKDDAVRDVFQLEDRGKRKLALRYEFTFQLKRIANNKKLPYKRYQIGYNFRDEPIRQGRTRQFIQCDVDVVGSTKKEEAEILSLTKKIMNDLKINSVIYINNRKLMNEIVKKEGIKETDSIDVIREIDKLDKLSKEEVKANLKKYKAEKLVDIFTKPEEFFKKFEFYKEIEELKKYAKSFGVEVEFRPYLARGFSYYIGSVFEVWSKDINVAITGGGTYLINNNESTGISFGIEPIFLISKIEPDNIEYLVVSLDEDKKAIELSQKLREKNKSVVMFYGKPSKALDYANSYKINKVIFVGADEVKSGKFKVKDMASGRTSLFHPDLSSAGGRRTGKESVLKI
ncbi:MAG: ATP phosphoribosyltransferase regulatory subunit [Nanoarchaeota archaeon]